MVLKLCDCCGVVYESYWYNKTSIQLKDGNKSDFFKNLCSKCVQDILETIKEKIKETEKEEKPFSGDDYWVESFNSGILYGKHKLITTGLTEEFDMDDSEDDEMIISAKAPSFKKNVSILPVKVRLYPIENEGDHKGFFKGSLKNKKCLFFFLWTNDIKNKNVFEGVEPYHYVQKKKRITDEPTESFFIFGEGKVNKATPKFMDKVLSISLEVSLKNVILTTDVKNINRIIRQELKLFNKINKKEDKKNG